MNNWMEQFAVIAGAIISVAIIAVLVSQKANTSGVLNSVGSAFSGMLGTALGPITGGGSSGGSSSGGSSSGPTGGYASQIRLPTVNI